MIAIITTTHNSSISYINTKTKKSIIFKIKYNGSMNNESYVNFDHDYSYPLQWLLESQPARWAYQRWIWRSTLAKQGRPCRNTYQEELRSNLKKAGRAVQEKYKDRCECVPEGRSFALKKAVDNIAAQMAGGVDTYEYHINDPYMLIDPETEDLLAAKCEQDYIENNLQLLAPVFSDDIMWYGMAAALVKYDPKHDKNKVMRVHPKNIWFDTRYSATGCERFRGYSTMISWKCLKKMIQDDGDDVNLDIKAPEVDPIIETGEGKDKKFELNKTAKYSNRKIRSLNGLDIYVESLNRLAQSPSLISGITEWNEYDHDLRQCYNLNWYQSFASDPKKRTDNGYNGDDVELTVIYDLAEKVEYKIINRRYVVSANGTAFKRKIEFKWKDPRTGMEQGRLDDFCLECPLKFAFETANNMDTAPHPWAPVFPLLDSHDELCGWRARREHVSKILSILRIDTNGADAESLVGLINIMGGIYDDLQGDVTSLVFNYNYDPIDSEIAHLENQIQQVLHAYDQFDALQAMGDRASAAESGMATFAVAQGLSVHQNALMELFADIARQCIANRVAYSPRQEFAVINNGKYSSLTIQQMALSAVINVKSKLAAQLERRQGAANALALLGSMGKGINVSAEGAAYLMQKALYDLLPRKMAQTFIQEAGPSPEELALAQQQAQNDAQMLAQNQQMYQANPLPYEVEQAMNNYSPDEIDTAIKQLGNEEEPSAGIQENDARLLDMESQPGAMALEDVGALNSDLGALLANPNSLGAM